MGLRHAAALALIIAGPAIPSAESQPTAERALALARFYLASWQNTLASLIAEEAYTQQVIPHRQFASREFPQGERKRLLRSEILLLHAPADDVWLSFRDVIAVNGRVVVDRQKRFDELLTGSVAQLSATAERIEAEGFRFNLGKSKRTVNTPTAALVFLLPQFHANTTWDLDSNERLNGRRVWEVRFEQRKPPFAVRIPAYSRYVAQGSFWLEPDTGAILQWDFSVRAGFASFRVKTTYGPVPAIPEGLVPLRMEDEYDIPQLERLHGVATYSKHRLFRTAGRVIGP